MSDRTRAAVAEVMDGRRRGLRALLPTVGPAVIASVAYMDPGNFATNIQAGAAYGYGLLWVVVLANLVAMLFQAMSAKLGIVTGRNLPELCREQFSPRVVWAMWGASEIAAMATDLAEFLGGAIGLSLLFHLPLMLGMVVTGIVTYGILSVDRSGFRPMELFIAGLVGLIGLGYVIELIVAPPDWRAVAYHSVVPQLADGNAVTLAVAIVGATVMPHAIYLHSSLTQDRFPNATDAQKGKLIGYSNREVLVALGYAGLVNMAMVAMAAAAFHAGHSDIAEIETAYYTLIPLFGVGAAAVFLVALMASGISASAVGTMGGQVIMQGFVGFRIPVWIRRLVTMVPSFVVVALGFNATISLVISQVVLSVVLPVPMVALLLIGRRRSVMGAFRTSTPIFTLAIATTAIVLALNAILLLQVLGVPLPLG